jgi:hypothetical protein
MDSIILSETQSKRRFNSIKELLDYIDAEAAKRLAERESASDGAAH